MTDQIERERKAFKKYAEREWGYNLRRSKVNSYDYHYPSTQNAWQGWLARAQAARWVDNAMVDKACAAYNNELLISDPAVEHAMHAAIVAALREK